MSQRPRPGANGRSDPAQGEVAASALLRNLVVFGRFLRRAGLRVDPARQIELARALSLIDLGRREDFREAARAVVVTRREDNPLFDRAFEAFWRRVRGERSTDGGVPRELLDQVPGGEPQVGDELARSGAQGRESTVTGLVDAPAPNPAAAEAGEEDADAPTRIVTYSPVELLRQKDFADCTPEELAAARRLMRRLRLHFGFRRSRRHHPSKLRRRFDPRTTFRRGIRQGWDYVRPAWRAPQRRPRPLVVLCDISGSMERYSRLLLHFLYALQHRARHVESFVFGTRLTRVTRQLRRGNIDEAVQRVAEEVVDWSGGTRIGESLGQFNRVWARRVLGRGAVVVIISDGWDRGDIDMLRREMARLQRSCHRLIWLNPLLGTPEYRPLTQGIMAALEYVDDFLPAHSLASLEALAASLQRLSDERPARAQRPLHDNPMPAAE